ncbi:hypothetical protein GE09DRAFT_1277885 [Coniochaeta sp. 2T2.1]|nr:hypothetical protein GE09DRAFT_1277885 [Coniochaeta sp. 2T2.1]
MASSSQPAAVPPNASPPSATSTSPPTSTTTASTITTANQASSTVSPPAPSTTTSSLSSPAFPPPNPHPHPHPPPHHPLPHPNHAVPPSTTSNLSPTLPPTISSDRQISEARQAVLASIGNMLDSSLRDRASVLHSNAAAIAKQERDVAKATQGLRKENDKLAKVARDAAKGVKELGNVQNWAEVLESDFLAIEETIRLVREGMEGGSDGEEGRWTGSGSEGSWSESGDEGGRGVGGDGDGEVRMDGVEGGDGGEQRIKKLDKGKGRETDERVDDHMDVDNPPGAAGRSVAGRSGPQTGDTDMDAPSSHIPAMQSIERDAPSIKVPGLEPSQTITISLEDELRIAMDQPIGSLA